MHLDPHPPSMLHEQLYFEHTNIISPPSLCLHAGQQFLCSIVISLQFCYQLNLTAQLIWIIIHPALVPVSCTSDANTPKAPLTSPCFIVNWSMCHKTSQSPETDDLRCSSIPRGEYDMTPPSRGSFYIQSKCSPQLF